jgi:hypothetical protein
VVADQTNLVFFFGSGLVFRLSFVVRVSFVVRETDPRQEGDRDFTYLLTRGCQQALPYSNAGSSSLCRDSAGTPLREKFPAVQ